MRFESFQRVAFVSAVLLAVAVISAPGCGGVVLTRCVPGGCQGCCDANQMCVAGTIAAECGSDGVSCKQCQGGMQCRQGQCVMSTNDGGTDGGSGGGTGGGSGGGSGGGVAGGAGGGSGGGMTDGGLDGGPKLDGGFTSQLWFSGAFATAGVFQLGRELRPSGARQTLTLPGTRVGSFAVRPDGRKLVVGVNGSSTDKYDLYLTNIDGSAPTLLASAPSGGGQLINPGFSPDGTLVAFLQSDTSSGTAQTDLFVVPVTGGTPVRVSPMRSGTSPTLSPISWAFSRDSSRIAVVGDFNFDRVNELSIATLGNPVTFSAVVSAGEAGPAPGGTVTSGAQGSLEWTSAGKLLFTARLANDGSCGANICVRLYQVDGAGTNRQYHQNSPLAATQIAAIGVSADGTQLAYAADTASANAFEVFVVPAGGATTPVRVTSGTVMANRSPLGEAPLRFSPDGKKVAFVANYAQGGLTFEPYAARVDGVGGEVRLMEVPAQTLALSARDVFWNPESTQLAVYGYTTQPLVFELLRLNDVTTAKQTPVVVTRPPANGSVGRAEWTK